MKATLIWLVSAALVTSAAAQTSTNSQTSASTQNDTSVSASQSGVKANSTTSTSASENGTVSRQGKPGSGSEAASTSGSAANQPQAGANASAVTVPSGLTVPAVLSKSLDSKKNKQGDEVTAKTAADVLWQGKILIPRNSKLIGHVTEAKARGNGESESVLGIVFDRAILKDGQSVPLQATIQALASPVRSATVNDDAMYSGAAHPAGGSPSSGGGPMGGATGAVGAVAGGATNTIGGVANSAGDVAGNAGSTVGTTVNGAGRVGDTAAGVTGVLNSGTTGVIGLKGLQLDSATSNSATGSIITSAGKNVKLDSGSQMILRTGASADSSSNK